MALQAGTRLGPYEIVSPIGAGGMGEVYRATDTRLNRPVAVKVLPDAMATDEEFRARFDREARAIGALNHPNVCVLHDVGRDAAHDFLVMELLEGETLAERLRRGPLPLDQILRIGIQICDGLAAAHRTGIVHRDFKPGNVMLTGSGVKVLDFGLARRPEGPPVEAVAGLTQSTPLTIRGTVLGTPGYIAPEQLLGRAADARSDIFALGAVLYEMATGSRAFGGESHAQVIAAVLERDPTSGFDPALPWLFRSIVSKCLAKDPERRWHHAADVADALRWVGESPGVASRAEVRRSSRLPWLAAGLAGLAAVSAFAALGLRGPAADDRVLRSSIVPAAGTGFAPRDVTGTPHFALSPDGNSIVFVALAAGEAPRLWLRSLALPSARPLAGTEDASGPFWSPDNAHVGFFAGGRLKTVSITGGGVQDLAEIAFDVTGGSWSPDGTILFGGPTASGLFRISSSGGRIQHALELDANRGETGHRWPQFLPDGRSYLFYIRATKPGVSGVYVMQDGAKTPRQILESRASATYVEPGYLMFERNGTLMAQRFDPRTAQLSGEAISMDDRIVGHLGPSHTPLSASASGRLAYWNGLGLPTRLEIYDRSGRRVRQIGSQAVMFGPELSRDGRHLLVTVRPNPANNDLVAIDLAGGDAPTRLTLTPGAARFGIWSADGERIVFSTLSSEGAQLFEKPSGGAGQEKVFVTGASHWSIFPLDWSLDNEWFVYGVSAPTAWDIWAVGLRDQQARPILATPANEIQAQLSPDGKWLAYVSDQSGTWNVYVTTFPTPSRTWQISPNTGAQPRWRPDGKELFYLDRQGTLMSVSIGGTAMLAPALPHRLFETRAVPTIAPFRISYAVATGGQQFFITNVVEEAMDPITLVHNWHLALAK